MILISVFRYLTKIFSQKKLRIQGRVWLEDFNLNTFILAKGIGTKGTCTKQCSDLDLVQGQFKPLPISTLGSPQLDWAERRELQTSNRSLSDCDNICKAAVELRI